MKKNKTKRKKTKKEYCDYCSNKQAELHPHQDKDKTTTLRCDRCYFEKLIITIHDTEDKPINESLEGQACYSYNWVYGRLKEMINRQGIKKEYKRILMIELDKRLRGEEDNLLDKVLEISRILDYGKDKEKQPPITPDPEPEEEENQQEDDITEEVQPEETQPEDTAEETQQEPETTTEEQKGTKKQQIINHLSLNPDKEFLTKDIAEIIKSKASNTSKWLQELRKERCIKKTKKGWKIAKKNTENPEDFET